MIKKKKKKEKTFRKSGHIKIALRRSLGTNISTTNHLLCCNVKKFGKDTIIRHTRKKRRGT